MYVGALGNIFNLGDELRNFLPVKFVVSQHINYWTIRNGLENLFDSVPPGVNVSGKNNDFRIHFVHLERRELQVEVAQNVNAHSRFSLFRY